MLGKRQLSYVPNLPTILSCSEAANRQQVSLGKVCLALDPQRQPNLGVGMGMEQLARVPVTTFASPHLAAEPVPVVIKINLHDEVVHLCDPHKPVALQEPRRQCSSVLRPQGGEQAAT